MLETRKRGARLHKLVIEVAKCAQPLGMNEYATRARAFIVVLEEHALLMPRLRAILDSQYFAIGDLGAAVVTVCYAAEDLGLGSLIIGMYDREKLRSLLNISIEKRFAGLIALGYPANGNVRPKQRKQLEEIARFL